jgi:hypothetical protein
MFAREGNHAILSLQSWRLPVSTLQGLFDVLRRGKDCLVWNLGNASLGGGWEEGCQGLG